MNKANRPENHSTDSNVVEDILTDFISVVIYPILSPNYRRVLNIDPR
jgi:hypothetical protein